MIAEVLAAWRRAERLTESLPAGSPEHEAAVMASNRLRDLYAELTTVAGGSAVNEADARALLAELG